VEGTLPTRPDNNHPGRRTPWGVDDTGAAAPSTDLWEAIT
jgi:hypothetical protein